MQSDLGHRSRREALSAALRLASAGVTGGLAACAGEFTGFQSFPAQPQGAATPGTTIGGGSVKVGLILPLSAGGQAGAAASAMRNAAELAMSEFQSPGIQILVKDDGGTAEGAREAARRALAEGADILLGPLFAAAVQAAGQVARAAGKPVIAFSTDANVAARGTYLLSFMPEGEVERVIAYAATHGRHSFAALIPDTAYGLVAEGAFRQAAAAHDGRVVAIERYPADGGRAEGPVTRVAALAAGATPQADALFIPDDADMLPAIGQYLQLAGVNPAKVRMLGTGAWNDPRVFALPAFGGGLFAATDTAGFTAFASRYRAKFGAEPPHIATLSYDAVSLTAALVRTQGSRRFTEAVLTTPSGFNGADGVFRFRPDGLNERALAVLQIRNGAAVVVSPAPRVLGGSGA